MRTKNDIDDKLVGEAMSALGPKTKKATVDEALRRALQQEMRRRALRELVGSGWDGDLGRTRAGGIPEPRG